MMILESVTIWNRWGFQTKYRGTDDIPNDIPNDISVFVNKTLMYFGECQHEVYA